jgi:hypothetical protein
MNRVEQGLKDMGSYGTGLLTALGLESVALSSPAFLGSAWVVAVASGVGIVGSLGCGVGVFAGVNEVIDGVIEWKTNGDSSSFGEWLATTAAGREMATTWGIDVDTSAVAAGDKPPPSVDRGSGQSVDTSSSADQPTTGETSGSSGQDTSGQSSGSSGQDTSGQSSDTSGQDTSGTTDSSSAQPTTSNSTSGGITLPPDLDNGPSGQGNIVLYAITGLAGQEARRQLASIDFSAGGQWGAPSKKETPLSYLLLVDQMLGGMYLRSIHRNLDSEANKYGVRDRSTTSVQEVDANKLKNFGLTYPLPLDLMFTGKTSGTLKLK